jgi:hypothetical protein
MNWEMFCLVCLAVGLALPVEERMQVRRPGARFGGREEARGASTAIRTRMARGKEDER